MPVFADRVVVITGASSGIGKAIALTLADRGATVCLIGRDLDRLKTATASISAHKSQIFYYRADLLVDEDIHRSIETIQSAHQRIDLLIHSAGEILLGNLETAPIEDFDRQYRLNVRAPYLLTQKLLPLLKASQGQIVFINSSVCQNAKAGIGQYTATKQALKAIADCLRAEVNVDGIRVVSFYVGQTATPMQAALYSAAGKPYQPDRLLQAQDIAETVLHTISLSPTAEVTDVYIRPLTKSS
jgi:NADP-dependent 3-hydroxy acid dehydrogenase YdfG